MTKCFEIKENQEMILSLKFMLCKTEKFNATKKEIIYGYLSAYESESPQDFLIWCIINFPLT
jgi:hypothetical protein